MHALKRNADHGWSTCPGSAEIGGGKGPMTGRRTIVVHNRLAGHMALFEAARAGANGVRVLTMGHLAAWLAGGFIQPIDPEALRNAVRESLAVTDWANWRSSRRWPGMVHAAVDRSMG
jgi:hypothetical protein